MKHSRKVNITQLGTDDIILGLPFFPYIKQTNGEIDWIKEDHFFTSKITALNI